MATSSYGCPPLTLKAPVWQHACCTKTKNQTQICHVWGKKQHEHAVATKRVSKNLQQGRSGGEGTENRRDNASQKNSEDTVQLQSIVFLRKSFLGQTEGEHNQWGMQIVYILESKRSTDTDDGFLEVKEAEANEQHKSIIVALRAAAPKWKFEQNNFVVITVDLFWNVTSLYQAQKA